MSGSDRGAFVTGGGRGLGRAIAAKLAGSGYRVGLFARTAAEVEEAAAAIASAGGEARGFAGDVLDVSALKRGFARFLDWAGGCESLVCAAGRLRGIGPAAAVDPDAWWLDVETSLRGTHLAFREAYPALRRSGRGSACVLVGAGHNEEMSFGSGYGAAQAGLARLVESLAVESRPDGVAAYAVYPGLVLTALTQHVLDDPEGRRWLPRFTEAVGEGKECEPWVVAEMVAWLADRRPPELSGRVVPAPATPEMLELRLGRIREGNLNVLRLR